MKQNTGFDEWCRAQEKFLRHYLYCLQQGRIRVHAVENNRFIDTTDEITDEFKKQLAMLRTCYSEQE